MLPQGEEDNIQFSWGPQTGVAGTKGDVGLYESFTYDGVEYSLYDCVFLLREGETEPDIGKIVKIWETASGKRKVKIVWFFRPLEIQNWLRGIQPLDKEILLASGEGKGLSNINPLEAISGKCNVVCTSKDKRNQLPSKEKVMAADYIFFRTFDVGNCKISLRFPDIIAGTEVTQFFNRDNYRKPSASKIRIGSRNVNGTSSDKSLAGSGRTSCNQLAAIAASRHESFSSTSSPDPRPLKKRMIRSNAELSKGVTEKDKKVSKIPLDSSTWFKPQPWEEKLHLARGRGTLVLLENLDPSFTSSEVEDIVWHAFGARADAKMVQRTALSSPYYGQALVIFRTKEAAELAISEMKRKCLMLSNGRPVVARRAPFQERGTGKFVGHLEIDRHRSQKQRQQMRDAVSTSHFAQPNNVEHDMAMEWCALQVKSDLCFKLLHEQQRKEIKNLRQQLRDTMTSKQ